MGKMQRAKGAAFERLVARLARGVGIALSRNLNQYQKSSGKDLVADSNGHFPFCIQCQHANRVDVLSKLAEATGAREPGEYPVAVVRRTGKPITATMYYEDWLNIVEDCLRFRKIMMGVQTAIMEAYRGKRTRPVTFVNGLAVMKESDFRDWFGSDD